MKSWSSAWNCLSTVSKLNQVITMGAQRVTNTPTFTGCPTITDSNKKTTKRRHLRPLNRKIKNSFITGSNYRTASLGWGWSEPSLAVLYSLKLYQSSFFCKMRFFDTIATGGSSYLWLGCDKRWNCAVLAMAMVRLPTTSCWCLSIDTRYSTINELKRIASLYSTIFAQRKATKSMLWKL